MSVNVKDSQVEVRPIVRSQCMSGFQQHHVTYVKNVAPLTMKRCKIQRGREAGPETGVLVVVTD